MVFTGPGSAASWRPGAGPARRYRRRWKPCGDAGAPRRRRIRSSRGAAGPRFPTGSARSCSRWPLAARRVRGRRRVLRRRIHRNTFRLSSRPGPTERIVEGVGRLADVIQRALAGSCSPGAAWRPLAAGSEHFGAELPGQAGRQAAQSEAPASAPNSKQLPARGQLQDAAETCPPRRGRSAGPCTPRDRHDTRGAPVAAPEPAVAPATRRRRR